MEFNKLFRKCYNYTIEVTEETSLEETVKTIEDGLRVMNKNIFGDYIEEYVSNPVKDSYYLKIDVVDTTGMARVYRASIIKVWNCMCHDYEVFVSTISTKKRCLPEEYFKVAGISTREKISKIFALLDQNFVFKENLNSHDEEEEDTENDEEQDCDCPFCHVCQSEDTKSDNDGDNMIELTLEDANRLNKEFFSSIFSGKGKSHAFVLEEFFNKLLKERKETKKHIEQKKEDEDLNKLYNSIEESLNDFKKTYKLDPVIVSNIETIMDYLKTIKKRED